MLWQNAETDTRYYLNFVTVGGPPPSLARLAASDAHAVSVPRVHCRVNRLHNRMQQTCIEAWPLARMWMFAQRAKVLPKNEDLAFCYDVLNKVSRR